MSDMIAVRTSLYIQTLLTTGPLIENLTQAACEVVLLFDFSPFLVIATSQVVVLVRFEQLLASQALAYAFISHGFSQERTVMLTPRFPDGDIAPERDVIQRLVSFHVCRLSGESPAR